MHDQATGMRAAARMYAQGARAPRPYVLTVTSGKGGVGKSTVALNVGLTMAMLGQRVLLFDADGNLAGLDVMSGVAPRFRLGDVLRGEQDLDSVLVTLVLGPPKRGVLKALKNSARNCTRSCSRGANSLNTARSKLRMLSSRMSGSRSATLPKVNGGGWLKTVLSK